jgi:glutamyl-tRNA synthetase
MADRRKEKTMHLGNPGARERALHARVRDTEDGFVPAQGRPVQPHDRPVQPHDRPVRTRIAPSPTGNCHVGTARNALYNLLYARQHGGRFVLRIDDTDAVRSTQASEEGVLEGLRWLGLDWDEGPDVGGPYGPYRSSERLDLYWHYLHRLLDAGRAYYCFCTPEELEREREQAQAEGRAYRYSGKCRALAVAEVNRRLRAGRPSVMRFVIEPGQMIYRDLVQGAIEQDAALIGDPVIWRSDGRPTYNFATVVDEIEMEISHVLRSAEHISNTFPQLQMYEALQVAPPAFGHFGLLLNADRSKISKRSGATYIGEFHDQGYLPEAMVNHLALSGWNPGTDQELFCLDDLLRTFSLDRCSRSNAVYDRDKLSWLNGVYIRDLSAGELASRLVPYLENGDVLPPAGAPDAPALDRLARIVALEQERLKTLAEAPDALRFFYHDPDPAACIELLETNRYARRHSPGDLGAALAETLEDLRALDAESWQGDALERVLDARGKGLGWKRAELLMPIRIAVSARAATPPLFETLEHLGRDTALRRLAAAVRELHVPA